MKAKKVIKNAPYWKAEAAMHEADAASMRVRYKEMIALREQALEDNKALIRKVQRLQEQQASRPLHAIDPQAEVVMGMKRATEYAINTSAALLDAMGDLVDNVSGRRDRKERERRDGITIHQEDLSR